MQKIFYNKTTKIAITDIKGKKTLTQIKSDFGKGNYQELIINEGNEGWTIKNNILQKTNLIKEQQNWLLKLNQEKINFKNATTTTKLSMLAKKVGLE